LGGLADQVVVGGDGRLVVVVGSVVEVIGATVVDVDGRVVGGVGRRGAVEAMVGGAGAIVVGLGAAVVGGTVETGTGTLVEVVEVVDAVVVFVVVNGAGIDRVRTVVDSAFCWLVNLTGRDSPGDPPSTSAPRHRPAKPSNPAQASPARHLRFCARERSIACSSTVWRPT
jgi:hypothetical protein